MYSTRTRSTLQWRIDPSMVHVRRNPCDHSLGDHTHTIPYLSYITITADQLCRLVVHHDGIGTGLAKYWIICMTRWLQEYFLQHRRALQRSALQTGRQCVAHYKITRPSVALMAAIAPSQLVCYSRALIVADQPIGYSFPHAHHMSRRYVLLQTDSNKPRTYE